MGSQNADRSVGRAKLAAAPLAVVTFIGACFVVGAAILTIYEAMLEPSDDSWIRCDSLRQAASSPAPGAGSRKTYSPSPPDPSEDARRACFTRAGLSTGMPLLVVAAALLCISIGSEALARRTRTDVRSINGLPR